MYTTCTHTLQSGATCKSPAVRGTTLCFHHTPHEIRPQPSRPKGSFELPTLDSRNSVLVATNDVLQRLAQNRIKRSEAETLLKALKIAARMMTEMEDGTPEPELL